MARFEASATAGFFPTPGDLLPSIASVVDLPAPKPKRYGQHFIFDPCAGDGSAVRELVREWISEWADPPGWWSPQRPKILTCEMEEKRARQGGAGGYIDDGEALHGDAFGLTWDQSDVGAAVLYLNPPYDQAPVYKRLEERFLVRFTAALAPGGVLLYVVPAATLRASSETLARHYREHRAWKFPSPFFEQFGQVVLAARRRRIEAPDPSVARALIESWSDPSHLWPLPERVSDPLEVEPPENAKSYKLSLNLMQADLRATIESWRPMAGLPTGVTHGLEDLIGRAYQTAMPPRPAHLALAVASGIFNGRRVEPDDPQSYPPILLKGRFYRESVEVEAKHDRKGRKTGSVQVEQPRLELHGLRLDTYKFFEPEQGVLPSGAEELEKMNTADILGRYGTGIAKLMERQFPPLHHPGKPEESISLPAVARSPFECQRHAVEAALKTFAATGENPWLVAEVGTGKSQCALMFAEALRPAEVARTTAELERVGRLSQPLPTVRRALVMCPPHLIGSWMDQAASVVPHWRVVEIEGISDLRKDADLYILSRERAKLGPSVLGVGGGKCPRCGTRLTTSREALGRRRVRCGARVLRPANGYARDLERLAVASMAQIPEDEVVESVCAQKRALSSKAVDAEAIAGVLAGLIARVDGVCGDDSSWDLRRSVLGAVRHLASYLMTVKQTAQDLMAIASGQPPAGYHTIREMAVKMSEMGTDAWGADDLPDPGQDEDLSRALAYLHSVALWHEEEECGEPLFFTDSPRRVAMARWIAKRCSRLIDLFILDEAHEFNSQGSAQAKAAHRLLGLGKPTLLLSGSIMGGYASSLFANMWAASRAFRSEFGREEVSAFVDRYGYRRFLYQPAKGAKAAEIDYGSQSDRERSCTVKKLGEAPGILPTFLIRHLLPVAAMMHKDDLEAELPEMEEIQHPIEPTTTLDEEILAEYRRLESALIDRIRGDAYTPLQGRLLGQVTRLPSYLDRCTDDQEPFVLAYPPGLVEDPVIAVGRQFPASIRTAKERWVITRLRESLEAGDKAMVFLRHTGGEKLLPARLLKIFREEVCQTAQFLDAGKVGTRRREAWIDKNVNAPGCRVLIVNPRAVMTGLNNLVSFNRTLWHEPAASGFSAFIYRQANGRIHRIRQDRHCTVDWPFFAATTQEIAMDLVARKVSASLQVDGLSLTGALESCGLDPEEQSASASVMSIGKAIYEALTRKER